jgi:SPP1 gp7 family putative phage head morphogenesis protein
MISKERFDNIIKDIYKGTIDVWNLPIDLYLAIGKDLDHALYQGYGIELSQLEKGTPQYKTLNNLRNSNYEFSAAKTFQQVKDMQSLRYKAGQKIPFDEYNKLASQIGNIYNKTWQKVEEITTSHLADSAAEWKELVEDEQDFPLLEYVTVNDGRVRDEHQELDGMIKPVNDDFWTNYLPPNGWHCRCRVRQLREGEPTSLKGRKIEENPPLFNGNPGKREVIFKKSHPYYSVSQEYNNYKKRNFGFNIPDDDG